MAAARLIRTQTQAKRSEGNRRRSNWPVRQRDKGAVKALGQCVRQRREIAGHGDANTMSQRVRSTVQANTKVWVPLRMCGGGKFTITFLSWAALAWL